MDVSLSLSKDIPEYVLDCIKRVLAPFNTGPVTVYFERSFVNPGHLLRIEIQALPNNPFEIMLMDYGQEPYEIAQYLGFHAAQFYAHIPRLPVEDNIILGEE